MFAYNATHFDNASSWNYSGAKQVKWTGHYVQDGARTDMHFNHMVIQEGGIVHGQGSDAIGQFTLQGKLTGSNVNFTKQYHGAHSVQYNGTMNSNVMQGQWSIPGTCQGSFELRMETEQWKGYYEQGGQQSPMSFDLNVDDHGVFGMGSDQIGGFAIRGTVNHQSNVMQFLKQYHGAHAVQYYGQITKSPQNWTVNGHW
jgi:hypothetical protein